MRYKILDQNGMNFLTCTVVEWIDLFTRKELAEIILESLRYCQREKGLVIYGFCLMPSHLHLICGTSNPKGLSWIIQCFKSFTSKAILKYIQDKTKSESRREWLLNHFAFNARKHKQNSQYQVWQRDNHPIMLYSPHVIRQKLLYTHYNPVEAGMVAKPHYYLNSSATNYRDGDGTGVLDVFVMDDIWNDVGFVGTFG